MKPENKKIVSIIIIGLCALRIGLSVLDYFTKRESLTNPLIPVSFIVKLGHFCVFMSTMYGFVIVLNAVYLWKRRFFKPIAIISALIIILLGVFWPQISNYFITH